MIQNLNIPKMGKYPPTRTSVACFNCRKSKIRCFNKGDGTPCDRCKKSKLECKYLFTGRQLQKTSKSKKKVKKNTEKALLNASPPGYPYAFSTNITPVVMPDKSLWLEIADIFFKNQYQGIFPFIHKPSFYSFLRSKEFNPSTYLTDYYNGLQSKEGSIIRWPDPIVLLGILALCARLHPTLVRRYGSFNEDDNPHLYKPTLNTNGSCDNDAKEYSPHSASKYFGWHARMLLQNVFDRPTVQRIQALTMLSSHEWGEKNVARSFSYIGIAARMSLLLGLGERKSLCYTERKDNNEDPKQSFILQEVKRRTLWSVYMMDRCISSGRNRSSAIRVEDIKISLPCSDRDFAFGSSVDCMTFNQLRDHLNSEVHDCELEKATSTTFIIFAFELWAQIAKWFGEGGARNDTLDPWLPNSVYSKFSSQLDTIHDFLPSNLQYNSINLDAHIADNTAGSFGYLHSLLFLCRTFLNREYLYLCPKKPQKSWWFKCIDDLISSIKMCSMLISTLSSLNLMVVAPFTGFQIFTSGGTSLYLASFSSDIFEYYIKSHGFSRNDFKEISLQNARLLRHWGDVWTLANCWVVYINQMRKAFARMASFEETSQGSPIHSILLDYGSPIIQDENDRLAKSPENPAQQTPEDLKQNEQQAAVVETGKKVLQSNAEKQFASDYFDIGSIFPAWYDTIHADDEFNYQWN